MIDSLYVVINLDAFHGTEQVDAILTSKEDVKEYCSKNPYLRIEIFTPNAIASVSTFKGQCFLFSHFI